MGRCRSASRRQRQPRRGERHARVGRDGGRAGRAARHGQRRGQRVACRRVSATGSAAPAAAGVAAIVGHIYPVWLRFRGGKGVATACGVFSVLTPLAVPPALAIFIGTCLADEIHLARIGARVAGAAAAGVRDRQSGAGRRRRVRRGGAHRLPSSIEPDPAARPAPSGDWERGRENGLRVLGAGSWGTALSVHLGASRSRRPPLGARSGARRRDARPTRQRRLSAGRHAAPERLGDARPGRGGRRPRSRRVGDPVARMPRRDPRSRAAHAAAGAVLVSATKGLEADTLLRMSEVIAQEVGTRASRRRAVGSELRRRSGAPAADGDSRRVVRCRRDGARAGRIPRPVLPPVRQRRRRRRGDWRRAEEHHRDRRRRRGRASGLDTTRWRR